MIRWTRKILWVERGSAGLAGIGAGLLLAVVGNWLSQDEFTEYLPIILGVTLALWAIAIWLRKLRPNTIELKIGSPISLHSESECREQARRAYVGFVPLFTPKKGSPALDLSAEARTQAIKDLNFGLLDIEQSNFQPTIHAITCHHARLTHCWLVSTHAARGGAQSIEHARLLVEYLRQRKGLQCEFHYGENYMIELDEDALVFDKTHRKIVNILQEATDYNISARDIVADISTGVRSMTMGMVLACLDQDHDVELVGTRYNPITGSPEGELFPLIFRFQPTLVPQS